jgi:hypothetical protein
MAKFSQKSNARDLSFSFVIVLLHELAHTHCSLLLYEKLYEMAMATWELCLQQCTIILELKILKSFF